MTRTDSYPLESKVLVAEDISPGLPAFVAAVLREMKDNA
jgi:hypothetical protein